MRVETATPYAMHFTFYTPVVIYFGLLHSREEVSGLALSRPFPFPLVIGIASLQWLEDNDQLGSMNQTHGYSL